MNIFDIVGPIMIGPSSSHTAGAARIGRVAWKVLGEDVAKAKIELSGSFAATYRGHGTDKAIVAGIMGMSSHDERLRNSLEIAKERGIDFEIIPTKIPDSHPNTARLTLTGVNGAQCVVQAASIGGGNVRVTNINGMTVDFSGQYNTLLVLHHDIAGAIAEVTNSIANKRINIGNFRLSRPEKGGIAVMTIEVDGDVPDEAIDELRGLPTVTNVILLRKI